MNHLTPLERLLYGTDKDLRDWYNKGNDCGLSEFEEYRLQRLKLTPQIRDKIIFTIEFLIDLDIKS